MWVTKGDCRTVLNSMPENSFHACVTDPPYGIKMMNRSWDEVVPPRETWEAVLRTLRPGGFLLAFGGTRTYHRLAVAIEDAGFEIKDCIFWAYGSGFPKSMDMAKAIDRELGTPGETTPTGPLQKRMIPGADQVRTQSWIKNNGRTYQPGEYVPGSEAAEDWTGWGTALKPAVEPIIVARKPIPKGTTIAANVLRWGTGALNIDACRIGEGSDKGSGGNAGAKPMHGGGIVARSPVDYSKGRWPANLIHDGSEPVQAMFPEAKGPSGERSSARFFKRIYYAGKAAPRERGDSNHHPTVKPIALMRELVRLVTAPGGTVLDPFAGSGTTGVAALREGLTPFMIEMEQEHVEIIHQRIAQEIFG